MIPQHIADFLRIAIKSTWALDLLRLLKNTPERAWSAAELTAELRGSMAMVENILAQFGRWGLAAEVSSARFRYTAVSGLDATVEETLRLYTERPVAVIELIAQTPTEMTTAEKLQSFVDAFRLKKDRE